MTKVLLFSGGLDSYALRHLYRPDVSLYINLGTDYAKVEMAKLDHRTTVVDFPGLLPFERPDRIIPLRNLFLVAIAAQYGNEIAMAATAGDRVRDKTPEFAARASSLLGYLMGDYWAETERQYQVVLPVKHLTKRQLIQVYVQDGGDPEELAARSFSCYRPTRELRACGECKPCYRKWVAFRLNGIEIAPDSRPYIIREILPLIEAGQYGRADEENDILEALSVPAQ